MRHKHRHSFPGFGVVQGDRSGGSETHMPERWSLFRIVLQPWTRKAAQRVIVGRQRSSDPASGRFTRSDVDRLVNKAWSAFADLAADLPGQPTAGAHLNARLACLTLAFFRAFIGYGVAGAYAIELTADLTWSFYTKWGAIRRFFKKGDPLGNLRHPSLEYSVALPLPFNPPISPARWAPTSASTDGCRHSAMSDPRVFPVA